MVTSAIPDPAQEYPNSVADHPSIVESELGWKSTARAVVGLYLRALMNPFHLLNSVEQMKVNDRAIDLLGYTIYALHVLFNTPVFEDDFKERERRARVELTLKNIERELHLMAEKGIIRRFFHNVENAYKLGGLVDDVHKAVIGYQTVLEQDIYDKSRQLIGGVDRFLLHNVHHAVETRHHNQGRPRKAREDILLRLENIKKDVDHLARLIPLIDAYFTL